jgi:hypothetical protein
VSEERLNHRTKRTHTEIFPFIEFPTPTPDGPLDARLRDAPRIPHAREEFRPKTALPLFTSLLKPSPRRIVHV